MRWLVVLTLLMTQEVMAQSDLIWAIPAPGPQRTMYRSADSTSSKVMLLTSNDVLLIRYDGTDWCWAQDQLGHHGYMRCGDALALSELNDITATEWMRRIFQRQQQLGEGIKWYDPHANQTTQQAYGDSLNRHDLVYVAALSLFKQKYCKAANDVLLLDMMLSVAANPGSASEEPPEKLAAAFQCHPADFKKALKRLSPEERDVVLESTTTGLLLTFDEHDPAELTKRDGLIKALNEP